MHIFLGLFSDVYMSRTHSSFTRISETVYFREKQL